MQNTLDFVIIALLTVTIIYGILLGYRLSRFREGRKDILKAVETFNQTVRNAETTLTQIQKSTERISEQLKSEISKANLIRDDLVLLIDKAGRSKVQEEKSVLYSLPVKKESPKSFASAPMPSFLKRKDPIKSYESEAEKELFLALQRLKEGSST